MRKTIAGDFLFEALLMLTIVIAFMPMMVQKLADRRTLQENVAMQRQVENVYQSTKLFLATEEDSMPEGRTILDKDLLVRVLEPYGLPIGFKPITPLGHPISVIIANNPGGTLVLIDVDASKHRLSGFRRIEIAQRLGFYGATLDEDTGLLVGATGAWEEDPTTYNLKLAEDHIYMKVPSESEISELLSRRKTGSSSQSAMQTTLYMGGHDIQNVAKVEAMTGNFDNVSTKVLRVDGTEESRRTNTIGRMSFNSVFFQNQDLSGNALDISRQALMANVMSVKDISVHGDPGVLTADLVSVYEYKQADVSPQSFSGPAVWNIRENASFTNFRFYDVDSLEIKSYLHVPRPVETETEDGVVLYGIETEKLYAGHITVQDQNYQALAERSDESLSVLSIRLASESRLPDVYLTSIDNGKILIPRGVHDQTGATQTCENYMYDLGYTYNKNSLSQYLVCTYAYYIRIQKRLDIMNCLINEGEIGKELCKKMYL